jgi:protein-S-isoprenylcysteine O-methyltransferase Ste14
MREKEKDSPQIIAPPPFIFLGAIAIGGALHFLAPLPKYIPWPFSFVSGILCIALSLVLMVWAVRTFKRAGTNVNPYEPSLAVVCSGPFAYTRNPMYVGMALYVFGVALWANSPWIFLMLIPAILVIRYGVIKREEAYLETKFGEEYRSYKQRVRRWT